MIKKSFLFILLLFFVGCSTKISISTLKYGEVQNKEIRNIQIKPFRNDNINQTFYIKKELKLHHLLASKQITNSDDMGLILSAIKRVKENESLAKQIQNNK